MHLSVVVCSYTLERWDELVRAVESLRAQVPAPFQVILSVDYCTDLAARALANWPDVTVVENRHSQGLSGARNTGVEVATGEVVAFLDDDAVAEPGWAAATLAAYADPSVVGTAGEVLPDWRVPAPRWFPSEFLWVVGCSYDVEEPGESREVRNAIGASMSFRRADLDGVHGFDEAIGRIGKDAAGCEETELSVRVTRASGGRIVTTPHARARHAVTADRATRAYFRRRCRAEGRSKALVTRRVGRSEGLAAERRYATRALPMAVVAGIRDALRGDLWGLARAESVVEGLLLTAASYAIWSIRYARMM